MVIIWAAMAVMLIMFGASILTEGLYGMIKTAVTWDHGMEIITGIGMIVAAVLCFEQARP